MVLLPGIGESFVDMDQVVEELQRFRDFGIEHVRL